MMTPALEMCLVVSFASTHDAIMAEAVLGTLGVAGRLIPTPTAITSECGFAWRSPRSEKDALAAALATLAHEDVYELEL